MKIMAVPSSIFTGPKNVLLRDLNFMTKIHEYHGFIERELLEADPTYRQIIPYVLVEYAGEGERSRYCLMQRMKGQGEARLHGKHYIGAGGHVEEGHGIFYTALKEVNEELGVPLASLRHVGVFVSQGEPVGDVHLAVFYHATTYYWTFTSPEKALHEARWATREVLSDAIPLMESWSLIVARDYLNLQAR